MILHNAVVRTMDPERPAADSIALEGNRIHAVGEGPRGADPEVVDAHGLCVLPGFSDSHVHFASWALSLQEARLHAASLEEVLARVGAATPRPSGWICGTGWSEQDWGVDAAPTRHDLDRVTGDRPAALMSKDYHSLWVNSAALALAGADFHRDGGVVELDDDGEPTGILREEAAWYFRDTYARPTPDELTAACVPAIQLANERGVTAIHDKDGWLDVMPVWRRLHADGALTLRVWQSYPPEALDRLEQLANPEDVPVQLGYIKVFMDGTLGSGTALMLDGSGVEITSERSLVEVILRAADRGLAVGVHAIGDLANRRALNAFEATREAWSGRGLRPRIEHAQLLDAADVARFAEIGVTASVQLSHAPADRFLAEERWSDSTSLPYAFRALLDSGAVLANGSDAPVEDLDPLRGVRAGVTRTLDENPPWRPEQAIAVEEALRATTSAPAWLAHADATRGQIAPGRLADLVVLDRDPLAVRAADLEQIQVVATMFDGRWVHNAPPW